jgi:hypothetical protein
MVGEGRFGSTTMFWREALGFVLLSTARRSGCWDYSSRYQRVVQDRLFFLPASTDNGAFHNDIPGTGGMSSYSPPRSIPDAQKLTSL